METISYTLPPEQDGATVRHILKAALHVSSHAISRLTRTENGIRVNGIHARTVDILHTGDVLEVETSDHRPPRVRPTPGPWPLPIVWEDGHLLVVNKPAGMTAHASNFLPDTPTVAGALAWQRGADFVFHPVNRLDKGTTGLMVVAKSGYIHDRLRYALHTERFCREYRAVCNGCPDPKSGTIDAPSAGTRILWWAGASGLTVSGPSPIMRCWGGRTACPSCGCGRRQGGPISSGCTWPPSAAPWQGTGCTGKRTRT